MEAGFKCVVSVYPIVCHTLPLPARTALNIKFHSQFILRLAKVTDSEAAHHDCAQWPFET